MKFRWSDLILAAAMFFCPVGYNELFYFTYKLTGRYWTASTTFYALTGVLLIMWVVFRRKESNG